MKKILMTIMIMVLVLSQSVSAFAADLVETVDSSGNTSTGTVAVTLDDNSTTGTLYSVTVDWTDTSMEYADKVNKTWNPATHHYIEDVSLGWLDKNASVSVTNHSNAKVTASIAADAGNQLNYTFSKDSFTLSTAEGTEVDAAPGNTFVITVDENDVPSQSLDENFIVTITEAQLPSTIELSVKDDAELKGKDSTVTVLLPDGFTNTEVTCENIGEGDYACSISITAGEESNELLVTHGSYVCGGGTATILVTSIIDPTVTGTLEISCYGK